MVSAIGSSGDINPLLVIADRLNKEGHQVDFIASPHFADKAKRLGLNFLPLGTLDDYRASLKDPAVWQLETAFPAVWKLVMTASMANYELIAQRYTKGKTLLIGTSLAIGARFAQEKFELPMASIHLSPSLMLSSYDTPQSPSSPLPQWTPRFVKSLWIKTFDKLMLDRICCPPINKQRAQLGLAPTSGIITKWLHSPDLVICAFPDWFAAVQPDWPANSVNSNFPLFRADLDKSLPDDLEKFLSEGDPPMVLTAGTAMAFARPLLETGLQAALKSGMRCVLVCDFDDQIPPLPATAIHIKYANFHALFKRAAIAVHHGGIGTSASALAGACPQLIAPFAHDQFDNAMRLERMGVAKMIRKRYDINEWCTAINRLRTQETKDNCIKYANKLANEKSGEDLIIEVLHQRMIK